jgi:hypothetical protein
MFAVWQAAHDGQPNNWFNGDANKKLAGDNLCPFLTEKPPKSDGPYVCWTSNKSQHTQKFGYTYPEIEGKETGHAKEVQQIWYNKYSWARRLTTQNKGEVLHTPPDDLEPLNLDDSEFFKDIPEFRKLGPKPPLQLPKPSTPSIESLAISLPEAHLQKAMAAISTSAANIVEEKSSKEWYVDTVVERSVKISTAPSSC